MSERVTRQIVCDLDERVIAPDSDHIEFEGAVAWSRERRDPSGQVAQSARLHFHDQAEFAEWARTSKIRDREVKRRLDVTA